MNKICTSIEQSKKLIELGLDTNTADFKHVFCGTLHGEDIYQLELGEPNVDEECIVAWSLSALLGLMPKHIYQNDQVYFLYYDAYKGSFVYACEHTDYPPIEEKVSENPLDAAFEMEVYLLNNKIT